MPPDARNALTRSESAPRAWARNARSERADLPLEVSRLGARVAELERDYARLEQFAAIAAHELCEPLVRTEAYANVLLDRLGNQADPQSRSDLEALSCGAARMRVVVETLLHEARSGASLVREVVDLSELVKDCVDLLTHEIDRRRTRIVIQPLPEVLGQPSLLGTVMKNLLSNALRYGPRSGGTIRIGATRVESAWSISVVSQGKPIRREDRQRIFAAFERGAGERRIEGAGLGLAICRRIVERHGGSIGVEPRPRGNRFYFTVPD